MKINFKHFSVYQKTVPKALQKVPDQAFLSIQKTEPKKIPIKKIQKWPGEQR
jgi:hypothetical protein